LAGGRCDRERRLLGDGSRSSGRMFAIGYRDHRDDEQARPRVWRVQWGLRRRMVRGSVVMGLLYSRSLVALVVFGVAAQSAAAVMFFRLRRQIQPQR